MEPPNPARPLPAPGWLCRRRVPGIPQLRLQPCLASPALPAAERRAAGSRARGSAGRGRLEPPVLCPPAWDIFAARLTGTSEKPKGCAVYLCEPTAEQSSPRPKISLLLTLNMCCTPQAPRAATPGQARAAGPRDQLSGAPLPQPHSPAFPAAPSSLPGTPGFPRGQPGPAAGIPSRFFALPPLRSPERWVQVSVTMLLWRGCWEGAGTPGSSFTKKPGPGTGGHFVERRTVLATCPQPKPLHLTRRKWKKGQREAAEP